jgi:hypothetical protein
MRVTIAKYTPLRGRHGIRRNVQIKAPQIVARGMER